MKLVFPYICWPPRVASQVKPSDSPGSRSPGRPLTYKTVLAAPCPARPPAHLPAHCLPRIESGHVYRRWALGPRDPEDRCCCCCCSQGQTNI
ncbi:hypothetical protein E2C01_000831 [Portunus trituberculatus]|uniref:Uncharacterized protein n=1 Tax=Portunus trituberculatus TaxID=210409 RepID=A0A5B7CHN4_PORTR|nr:hypothetical protein [Portunus trituberculatus]